MAEIKGEEKKEYKNTKRSDYYCALLLTKDKCTLRNEKSKNQQLL